MKSQNHLEAFIAVGRDLSLVNVFRPTVIPFTDMTVGKEIITLKNGSLDVSWMTTPGHTGACCSLILKGDLDFDGKICKSLALVGDLWDCENDDEFWKDMSEKHRTQIESRNFITQNIKPDFIVPGHGPAFKGPYKIY